MNKFYLIIFILLPLQINAANIVDKIITDVTINQATPTATQTTAYGNVLEASRYTYEIHAECSATCTGWINVGFSDSGLFWTEIEEVRREIIGSKKWLINIVNSGYAQSRLKINSTNNEDMVINAWLLGKSDQ